MSSNQFLIDASSRHAVFLQRYSAGLERDIAEKIADALDAIIAGLAIDNIESMSAARFGSLQAELLGGFSQSIDAITEELAEELQDLLVDEADFSLDMFRQAVSAELLAPEPQQLKLAFDTMPFHLSPGVQMTIPQALSDYGSKKTEQVNQLLRDGYTQGKTSGELVREVRKAAPLQKRQAAALVRTATNNTSSVARAKTLEENMDIFLGYEIVATLDSKTSNLCKGFDGQIVYFNDSTRGEMIGRLGGTPLFYNGPSAGVLRASPYPAYHWSCRTTTIPKVDPKYDLFSAVEGVRPAVGEDGAQQVGAKTTYGGWLRNQPASFQDEALGPARAKLFRQGGLTVDKFVGLSGRTYTLAELKALNPLAFEKANI